MAYLSQIWLNPLRTGAQRLLNNPQTLHAAVLGGLCQQPATERVLWRLETDDPHRAGLLALTRSQPSWEHIIEQAGWASNDGEPRIRDYKPLLDRVQRGREFAFRLTANPVAATRTPLKPSAGQQERLTGPRPRGVRVPHRTVAHQLTWLIDRVASWGFELVADEGAQDCPGAAVQLVARKQLVFFKGSEAGQRHRVVLSTATFEGRLRISEPEAAIASLLNGVGPARAYGCGLITLAPLPLRLTES